VPKVQDAPIGSLKQGSRKLRFVLPLLALVLLCGFSGLAFADGDEGPGDLSAQPSELPEKRTATSDTYELHSGLLETRIYGTPVNFENDEGQWEPIEEGLEEAEDGEITNGGNSVQVSLPSELQEGAARLTIGDQWVASELLATETEAAEISEGAALYESPEANTAFEYTTLPDGLKEEIELKGPDSPTDIRFELTASPGLSADLLQDGSIAFKNEKGEVVASLPAPTVADSDSLAPSPDQVTYQLAPREGGAWVLTVSVDREWLEAPGRSWPVSIDPTMTADKPDLDCVIGGKSGQEGWIDCASWGRQNLLAGYNAETNQAEDNWYRSLMFLQTAGIPKGADVSAASLELHSPEAAQNTSGIAVHRVIKPWNWQANWKRYTSGKNWEAEGGDYAPEALGEVKTSVRGSGAGWWSVPIQIAKVQEKAEKEEDLSVIVKLLDDKVRSCGTTCTHRLVKFDSSAATNAENRPYLRVLYEYRKAPSTSKLTSPEEGRKTSHYFTLQSKWGTGGGGAGVTGVSYQMQLAGWHEFRTIPAEFVLDGKGKAVAWPLPVTEGQEQAEPVYLDYPAAARAMETHVTNPDEEGIELRAIFTGTPTARGASEPVAAEYAGEFSGVGAPTDATASVGPANVDLLTGQMTISRTDVSIPVPGSESNLEFTRTYESNFHDEAPKTFALGGPWQPSSPMEQEFEGEAWTRLVQRHENEVPPYYDPECIQEGWLKGECLVEEAIPAADWIELFNSEGPAATFEIVGGSYVAPEYMKGWVLGKEGEAFTLTGPEGVKTSFNSSGYGAEYIPSTVSWQATAKSARMVYQIESNPYRLKLAKEISPPPPGVSACGDNTSTTTRGCRTLVFNYFSCSCWQSFRLGSISYFDAGGSGTGRTVAEYKYDSEYRLIEEWDPRISPALKETYTYETARDPSSKTIASLTPAGQAPWQFGYYKPSEFKVEGFPSHYNWNDLIMFGRLKTVSRASLVEGTPTATSTVAYQVPVSGSGAPYDMSPATVATWGQSDYPVDAAAIFPPDQVPSEARPSDFSHATVHYLDPEGYEVNKASAPPPGAEGPSITTSETDMHGKVVRALSPQNRLRALAAGASSASRSHELDSHSTFSTDGTEMLESWGPLHTVRLDNGEIKEARAHTVVKYEDPAPPADQTAYHLPTKETTDALLANGTETDQRASEIHYNWKLRKPIETIIDPGTGHFAITSVTVYDEATGMPLEIRQPLNSGGGGAGTTKFVYYSGGKTALKAYPECEEEPVYAGLPCKTLPAAQASGSGRPELLVKTVKSYNGFDKPTEIVESPGGGTANIRKTLLTYDKAGRQQSKKIEGGGVPIPKVETEYDENLGMPSSERFKCETECEGPQYQTAFGLGSSGHTALNLPTDVAVDVSGNYWVVDNAGNRIIEYSEAGEFIREAGGKGASGGKLSSPSAIAIDSAGNVDVTDTANNRVAQFSSTGAFIEVIGSNVNKTKVESGGTTLEKNRCTAASGNVCQAGSSGSGEGQIAEPIGITTSGGQNFFVVERANNRVEKLSPQAEVLAKFGSLGSENGQLKEPTAIAFQGFLLWVADTGNSRMEAFTTSYGYSRKFGGQGSGNGPLGSPNGVETDSSGNVWVSEQSNNRVQKFSENGISLLKFGTQGGAEGQLSMPAGLAIDSKGNVLIADEANNRVQKWSASGFDAQETKTTYDALGRPETYKDADGNEAKTTYDLDGRPVKTTDSKGWQVVNYDSNSGMPVELEDSAAGKFTASYNADGAISKRTLPDGLTAEITYDPTGAPSHLSYVKASNCGSSCLWLDFGLERSITGQIRMETGTLGTNHYGYDKAGRLISADETPNNGQCTTRLYSYDADSNRETLTTRSPGVGGVCASSGGTPQNYGYDAADRLTGPTYDSFGRITSLPANYAGGKTLTTSYFANDMTASQSQNGVTNSFQLDASLRQRMRLQGGGVEGTEVFHYDGGSDSPAWTELGSTWTRNIVGLGGELAAVQESGKEAVLQLTNLHGDVSATAPLNPEATSLKEIFKYDEFGNPTSDSAGRFGWLGGKQRRTELGSGVIQMGARSYVPQIGRFLSVDPISGGSANSYDYANADPIGQVDLGGDIPKEVSCSFEVHNPHNSSHRRGHINAVLTGDCFGTDVTLARARVRMIMYRNGVPVARTKAASFDIWIHPSPIFKPGLKVPFVNAPECQPGEYQVLAIVTVYAPPGYWPREGTARPISRKVTINC
jgi:RHS repeat-associated protein